MTVMELIVQALTAAAEGHPLTIAPDKSLDGAYVRGPAVQAYVFPQHSGGFEVDLWAGNAADAYEVVQSIPDLATAVRYAIESALRTKNQRGSRTVRVWSAVEQEER